MLMMRSPRDTTSEPKPSDHRNPKSDKHVSQKEDPLDEFIITSKEMEEKGNRTTPKG